MSYISPVKDSFSVFYSAPYTQKFLYNCYKKGNVEEAEKKSYENCYPFIYYLEHSQNYYELAFKAPLSIKPMLLFYGMTQLLKACLLTVDSEYPQTTSVLAHGVSTRKRKKQSYDFLDDEVKIQKNGLFSHISHVMFHVEHLEGCKYSMSYLLSLIPELLSLFSNYKQRVTCVKVNNGTEQVFEFPSKILDFYHMGIERFSNYLQEKTKLSFEFIKEEKGTLLFNLTENINTTLCSPIMFHYFDKSFYFPTKREQNEYFPEVLSHYLLLYNLSMISRYETEWWYELLHTYTSEDFPFISKFLAVSAEKVPYLLFTFLDNKKG